MPTFSRQISLVWVLAAAGCFVDRGARIGATTMDVGTSGGPSTGTPTTSTPTTGSLTEGGRTTGESTGETTGMPVMKGVCEEQCVTPEDCTRLDDDAPYSCKDGRCVAIDGVKSCSSDGACRASQSGWVKACKLPADCACEMGMECVEEQCVDIGGGVGRCVVEVTANTLCLDGLVQTSMPLLDANAGSVTVCATALFACEDGRCRDFCKNDKGCVDTPGHPLCIVDTGACVCTDGMQCAALGQAGYAACRDGRCGCADDADCEGTANADTCLEDGRCGCTSAAVCTEQVFTGTTLVCVDP